MSNKFLIHCSDAKSNSEDATVTFIIAAAAAAASERTAIFLSSDAVRLATPGYAEGVLAEGYEPFKNYLDSFLENGGELWVCPACAKARGIEAEELIDGAELTGAAVMINFVAEGAKMLK